MLYSIFVLFFNLMQMIVLVSHREHRFTQKARRFARAGGYAERFHPEVHTSGSVCALWFL